MDLSLGAPGHGGTSVPIVSAHVGVDRPVLLAIAAELAAVESESTERLELALDEVEPARIGGKVEELDVAAHGPLAEFLLVVGAEVVEDHHAVLGEAGAQRTEQLAHLAPGLRRPGVAGVFAGRLIVGCDQVMDPGGPRVGRPGPDRVLRATSAVAEPRLKVQGAELIEAEDPCVFRRVGVQVEDPVLPGFEVGIERRSPGLVVAEADALVVEDPPQLAAADRWHHPSRDEVRAQLGQAPGGESLTLLDRAGEGQLHDSGGMIGIDPARTAPGPTRAQGCEALPVGGVDELGQMGRARPEFQRDLRHALALERGEQQHRPMPHRRVPAAPHDLEEVGPSPSLNSRTKSLAQRPVAISSARETRGRASGSAITSRAL